MPPKNNRDKRKKTYIDPVTKANNARVIRGLEREERVNNEPAKIAKGETGRPDRIDAYYGGKGKPDGDGHGHLVSNDGLNAEYLRDPGMAKNDYVVDNDKDNPYK